MGQFVEGTMPAEAVAMRLYRATDGDRLVPCEAARFAGGAPAIDTLLRRAAISGRMVIGSDADLDDYFADVLAENGDMLENVTLDQDSYGALKNRWMRCRLPRGA